MTDPLTYLDEVDARVERYPEVKPPYLAYVPGEWIGVGNDDDRVSWAFDAGVAWAEHRDRADLLALSKALRAVIELHELAEWELDRIPECGHCYEAYPCPTVRTIQAALAVNDEGGK